MRACVKKVHQPLTRRIDSEGMETMRVNESGNFYSLEKLIGIEEFSNVLY